MPGMKAKGKIYPATVLIYTHSHEEVLDLNSGEKPAQSVINYVWQVSTMYVVFGATYLSV
jgi:hypothetical protein